MPTCVRAIPPGACAGWARWRARRGRRVSSRVPTFNDPQRLPIVQEMILAETREARQAGFVARANLEMPANNRVLVFQCSSERPTP